MLSVIWIFFPPVMKFTFLIVILLFNLLSGSWRSLVKGLIWIYLREVYIFLFSTIKMLNLLKVFIFFYINIVSVWFS